MSRRHPLTVLVALAGLLATGGPATAEETQRELAVAAAAPWTQPTSASEWDREETTLAAGSGWTTIAYDVAALEAVDEARERGDRLDPRETWTLAFESRFAELHEAAQAHAAQRPERAKASATLIQRLESLASGMRSAATVGIAVRELDTGASVFEHGADRSLNPASNQKLLTAVAALELLGEDYRFDTHVLRAGDALVLVGEGDPSLRVEDLERLAAEVASATDLHEIRRIIVDDTAFSARRFGPGYDPHGPGVSYMAPSGALSLQWNTVEVEVWGRSTGKPVRVRVSPPSEHVEVQASATVGRGSVSVRSRAAGEHTVIDVDGHLRPGTRHYQRRRVTDPGRFTGGAFAAMLAQHGASEDLTVELGPTPAAAIPLATHQSAALPQLLDATLAYSNNFSTEQVLRTLGWRMTGEPGDWNNGHRVLDRYWEAAGLSGHALEFENASGLSTHGRITAAALADLLAFAARDDSPAGALWSALPVAGREGTLRGRLRRSKGRVRAKTGTLQGASALSGVVETKGGRTLGFSILVNGPVSARRSHRLQDAVVMALLDHGTAG